MNSKALIQSDNVTEKLALVLSVNQQYRSEYNFVLASTYPTSANVTSYTCTLLQSGSGKPYWGMINRRLEDLCFTSAANHRPSFSADHANLLPQVLQISPHISPLININRG